MDPCGAQQRVGWREPGVVAPHACRVFLQTGLRPASVHAKHEFQAATLTTTTVLGSYGKEERKRESKRERERKRERTRDHCNKETTRVNAGIECRCLAERPRTCSEEERGHLN